MAVSVSEPEPAALAGQEGLSPFLPLVEGKNTPVVTLRGDASRTQRCDERPKKMDLASTNCGAV
jgi:hypothetical protein